MKPRIVLAGGSGFIGQSLSPPLVSENYEMSCSPAVNRVITAGSRSCWDGKKLGEWTRFVNGALGLVNLTGRSINTRHTPEHRREIIDSRVVRSRILGEAIGRCMPPKVFVQFHGRRWNLRRQRRTHL